ncbi:MAG TPA: PA0069 family radical SAM protein [Gemmatimonadota bacterium]|nr:PA0069 family radical SAM protein [Gemmatimonadota bacterium]
MNSASVRGRGVAHNPANRFEPIEVVRDRWDDPADPAPRTVLYRDFTRTVIARNDSPDVGFETSINPYRGCEHGCVYCYARPYHEYFGLSAGLDFETKIFVKEDAPRLLRVELSKPGWTPQVLALSGVTDPYQPAERRLKITRGLLEVLAEFRNPVGIVTKNYLVTRDLDHLRQLARFQAAAVTISVTTLDDELQRIMEPRTSSPARRLAAIARLAEAGIPVSVNVAPVIPGLTDHELPRILEAAAGAGATGAAYLVLRLPHGVKGLFEGWLAQHFPDRKDKVLNRIRSLRDGRLSDARFGKRHRGEGPWAAQLANLFQVTCRRLGLGREGPRLSAAAFRRPPRGVQLRLFD